MVGSTEYELLQQQQDKFTEVAQAKAQQRLEQQRSVIEKERAATAMVEDRSNTSLPPRVVALQTAIKLTASDRDIEYGPPAHNMACAGKLKQIIRQYMHREIDPAELEALDMVLTKVSRVVTGKPKADTYIDMAAYAAIAGENSGCF